MKIPLLSVFVITYKHAAFIKQTIESILNQQTDFALEIIVANDCSPDNTAVIISEIIETHPKGGIIRYYEHRQNLGMYENFMFALKKCRGKYIAICEGDDYWTQPSKLEQQFQFLETHPNYEVCFTNIGVVDQEDKSLKEQLITDGRKKTYTKSDLPIWAPTLTRVFRNRDFSTLPSAPALDTLMLLWQSNYGKIRYLDIVSGNYRQHSGGIYSSVSKAGQKVQALKTTMISFSLIEPYLYEKYIRIIFKLLAQIQFYDRKLFYIALAETRQFLKAYSSDFTASLKIRLFFAYQMLSLPLRNKKQTLNRIFNKLFSSQISDSHRFQF